MSNTNPTVQSGAGSEPREVAGYRILRQVGAGGMSAVYLSFDVTTSRPVAIKLLADQLTQSREFVTRFYREARLSRLLSHPNLVQGLAAGYDSAVGKHYLVLEFIDGPSANTLLGRIGLFPVGVAVQIAIHTARALAFLHSRDYVHRDVKPDNILLHPEGVAKLADLGLAKRLNDDHQLTAATQGVGTPYYMAYEQALNPTLVDGRSDIFALGATLYHFLTGALPFPGRTHEDVIEGMRASAYVPLQQHNRDIPGSLAKIINATLARDPRTRFQSAAELASALEATGLATPIPAYLQHHLPTYPDSEQGAAASNSLEAPTQADIKHNRDDTSSAFRPKPPTAPLGVCNARFYPHLGPSGPPSPRHRLWFILGAAVLIAGSTVGGIYAAGQKRCARPITPDNLSNPVHDADQPPSSPHPMIPQ